MIDNMTIEFSTLIDNPETNALIDEALSTYPMYAAKNPNNYSLIPTREELNKKIKNRYRFYNIGSETIARFLFNLQATMEEIMPFYYQQFKALDVLNGIDDPFGNVDITETFEQETSGTRKDKSNENVDLSGIQKTTGTTESDVKSTNNTETSMDDSGRVVKNNTPQTQLDVKSISGITAASEINWNESDSNSSSKSDDTSKSNSTTSGEVENESLQKTTSDVDSESSGITKHTLNRKGNQGVNTYAHDLNELMVLFKNVEQDILNDPELVKCFMLVW